MSRGRIVRAPSEAPTHLDLSARLLQVQLTCSLSEIKPRDLSLSNSQSHRSSQASACPQEEMYEYELPAFVTNVVAAALQERPRVFVRFVCSRERKK